MLIMKTWKKISVTHRENDNKSMNDTKVPSTAIDMADEFDDTDWLTDEQLTNLLKPKVDLKHSSVDKTIKNHC